MAREIHEIKSPAVQTLVDSYYQSGAKSLEQWVNNSPLNNIRQNHPTPLLQYQSSISIGVNHLKQRKIASFGRCDNHLVNHSVNHSGECQAATLDELESYQLEFTENINAPLTPYRSSYNTFKGTANYLVHPTFPMDNHSKQGKSRWIHDIMIRGGYNRSYDEELEWIVSGSLGCDKGGAHTTLRDEGVELLYDTLLLRPGLDVELIYIGLILLYYILAIHTKKMRQ